MESNSQEKHLSSFGTVSEKFRFVLLPKAKTIETSF